MSFWRLEWLVLNMRRHARVKGDIERSVKDGSWCVRVRHMPKHLLFLWRHPEIMDLAETPNWKLAS